MSTTAPTSEEFLELYPEFSAVSSTLVASQLDLATRVISTAWGDLYSDAIGLEAAHSIALKTLAGSSAAGGLQGTVGPISSVSAAGVSTSFNSFSPDGKSKSELWYGKTVYGQQLMRLRAIAFSPAILADS